MDTNLSAAELRCWAEQCDRRSEDPMICGDGYLKRYDGVVDQSVGSRGTSALNSRFTNFCKMGFIAQFNEAAMPIVIASPQSGGDKL
jgi:hypothetical protein